jgi:hypothetical protein
MFTEEFPDFPAAAVPSLLLMPGWSDLSWHNDACPMFAHDASGVGVWVNYPDPDQRETPDRFAAVRLSFEGGHWGYDPAGEDVLFETDDVDVLTRSLPHFIQLRAIAHAFALAIEEECADDIETIRARNATPDYAGCCASHDFCDANMPMLHAFETVMGRPIRLNDDTPEGEAASNADFALMGEAWNIARAERLTAPVSASPAPSPAALAAYFNGAPSRVRAMKPGDIMPLTDPAAVWAMRQAGAFVGSIR